MKLFLLFLIIVPLLELYVLIQVGSEIGAFPTIALTILTAIVGGWLMRYQGISTMQNAQIAMAEGRPPAKEMLEGVFIFVGGLFLLLPGFMTDALGLLFLLPPVRHYMIRNFIKQQQSRYSQSHGRVYESEWHRKSSEKGHETLEVTYIRTERTPDATSSGSPQDQSRSTSGFEKRNSSEVLEGEIVDQDNPRKPNS